MPKREIKKKSVLAEARSWATKRKLFGAHSFLRYVILRFAENLNQVSDDFVLKGGNLLWIYIETPRATTDLDLATLKMNSHTKVREILEHACVYDSEISYSLHSFKEVEQDGKAGAAVTIGYKTEQGAGNRFEVDIVYGLGADARNIESPVHSENTIRSATIENIVADKVSASHRFKSGNSRMKDYDDLWRLARSGVEIKRTKLATLLKARRSPPALDPGWINPDMEAAWKAHSSRYKDLPRKLDELFMDVNRWLEDLL